MAALEAALAPKISQPEFAPHVPKLSRPHPQLRVPDIFNTLKEDLLIASNGSREQERLSSLLTKTLDHRVHITIAQIEREQNHCPSASLEDILHRGVTTMRVESLMDLHTRQEGLFIRMPLVHAVDPSTNPLLDEPISSRIELPLDYEERVLNRWGILQPGKHLGRLDLPLRNGDTTAPFYHPGDRDSKAFIGNLKTNLPGVIASVDLEQPNFVLLWVNMDHLRIRMMYDKWVNEQKTPLR